MATRKGLFTLERGASGWAIERVGFLGDNCTLVMHDARSGDLLCALDHGHWGVKLHRSRDGGATWGEIAAPK
ncbi:MAG: exo-alpha-sialidase, partial [Gemmatimonadota bacterium]